MDFNLKYPSGMSAWKHPRAMVAFKEEALAYAEMPIGHPSADEAFEMPWENGHAYGLNAVVSELMDLVEIIKPEIWQELQELRTELAHLRGLE